MIVVDASLVVDYLLTVGERADLAEFVAAQDRLAAPSLMPYEVAAVLRRYNIIGELTDERAASCFKALQAFPIDIYDIGMLSDRAWALRHNLTYYDAVYVALAEMLSVSLSTTDHRLAASIGHAVKMLAFPASR